MAATPPKRRQPKINPPVPNCDAMEFDAEEQVVPVKIKKSDDHVEEYFLKEASGDAVAKWRNAMMNQTQLVDGKPAKIQNMADAEPLLVSLCLYTSKGTRVPVEVVRSWKSSISKALFARIKEISDIEDEEDENNLEELIKRRDELNERIRKVEEGVSEAKNELTDTTDGS